MIDVPVKLGARSYRILVGPGVLAQAGAELARLKVGRRVALVTDAAILALHGAAVIQSLAAAGFDVTTVLLPEGERARKAGLSAETARPQAVTVLKSGVVDGMAYTLYADGSIEAKLPHGTVRFGSIAELRAHIESNS